MTKFLAGLGDRIQRYPVLFWGAVASLARAKAHIEIGSADDLWLTGFALFLQSAYSVSKKTADERVANAAMEDPAVQERVAEKVEEAKYVGAVEHQAVVSAGAALAAPQRPLRPRA